MSADRKRHTGRIVCAVCGVILLAAVCLFCSANITDEDVVKNGAEYTVKLIGVHKYNAEGFTIAADKFNFGSEKQLVYVDENGYAHTTYEGKGEVYLSDRDNSATILYDRYNFCSEKYKDVQALEAFFKTPDRIYNYDINKFAEYVQDVIAYQKKFHGTAKVRIYRGRCVFTDIYIGEEKILELKTQD